MDYNGIILLFVDIIKFTFPIAIIFGMVQILFYTVLDFIFPNRTRRGIL